jgi:hypothetical protein
MIPPIQPRWTTWTFPFSVSLTVMAFLSAFDRRGMVLYVELGLGISGLILAAVSLIARHMSRSRIREIR